MSLHRLLILLPKWNEFPGLSLQLRSVLSSRSLFPTTYKLSLSRHLICTWTIKYVQNELINALLPTTPQISGLCYKMLYHHLSHTSEKAESYLSSSPTKSFLPHQFMPPSSASLFSCPHLCNKLYPQPPE